MAGYEELLPLAGTSVGELSPEEHAIFYGMASSVAELDAGVDLSPFDARAAGEVFLAFRLRTCPFCGHGLVDHALDLDRPGVMVRCRTDNSVRSAREWLAGPGQAPQSRLLLWAALWVGIPLVSLGLLSWLMPAVSGAVLRTGRWIWGAALWGVLTAFDYVVVMPRLPISEEAPFGIWDGLAATIWIFGIVWGAGQIRPWMRDLGARSAVTGGLG